MPEKSNFLSTRAIIESLEADPTTLDRPIKRQFVFDGEHLTANLAVIEGAEDTLHTQRDHDEIVHILEGDVDFQVGDEIRRVGPGDLIFVPRNTIHGPHMKEGDRFAALTVFAPFFDRAEKNIHWQRDED